MNLAKIVAPVVEGETAREFAFLAALDAMGYPLHLTEIYRVSEKAGNRFQTNADLMRACQEDGFDIFDELLADGDAAMLDGQYVDKLPRGRLSFNWVFADIMRDIIQRGGDDPTLFLIDDIRMTLPYDDFMRHMCRFEAEAPRYKLVQLFYLPYLADREESAFTENRIKEPFLCYYTECRFNRGIMGYGEHALLIRPEGAQVFLDALIRKGWTPEMVIWSLRDTPGFYSSMTLLASSLLSGYLEQMDLEA